MFGRAVSQVAVSAGSDDVLPARTLAEAAKAFGTAGATVEHALAPGDGPIGLSGSGRRTHEPVAGHRVPRHPSPQRHVCRGA